MKKLLIVAALALGLAGCQTVGLPSLNLNTAVAMNTVYGVENAYGVAITAADAAKSLPLCATGTTPGATNICVKRSFIVGLQPKVSKARQAVNNMVAFQKAYPTLDVTNVLSAAQTAVSDLQSFLASGAQ